MFCTLSLLPPITANAQTSVTGAWEKLNNLPIVPIHNHLLTNGKVLMWGNNSTAPTQALWDPVSQAFSTLTNPVGYNLFCSGHSFLADGRLLVAGGHISNGVGLANASIYDPVAGAWADAPTMNAGRWYPTVTTLANGDALVVSGDVDTTVGVNTLPQVYQAATNSWRNLTGAQLGQALYPRMFLAPNGKVIDVAPNQQTRYLDTTGTGTWSLFASRTFGSRDYASAVMYAEGKILVVGGGDPPTATAEVIDLNATTPAWRQVASMSVARRQLNTTLLPDGTVLATGGTSGAGFNNTATPVFSAELWNPATESWTILASASVPRLYHSSAFLLPDGRVVMTGGDGYPDVEVFSPPYLFKGTRPAISSAPQSIAYGQQFSVQSADAAGITKVTLIRLPSVTHAFNQNQRLNVLQSTPTTGAVNVTAPANANLAPPGHYLLFIVNGSGVPSVGQVVKLDNTAPTPTPASPVLTSIAPSSATAGGPGFTLTGNGSNFVSGAVVRWNGSPRATTFVNPSQVTAVIPDTDITATGTAQVSVLNPGGSASGTVPFTVTASPPVATTYSLTVKVNGTAASRGLITSNPAGISCGGTCIASFTSGKTVTLTASTNGNGIFAGWGGACTGSGACTVTMDGNKSVTATVNRR